MDGQVPSAREQAVVQQALARGFLHPDQLRAALLLQQELEATGHATPLLALLEARYLRPEHVQELRRNQATTVSTGRPSSRSGWYVPSGSGRSAWPRFE